MTNRRRAFEAIAAANDGFTAPEVIPEKALENLHHAGLITPDLPEPSYIITECDEQYPVWETDSGYSVEKQASGEMTIFYHSEPAELITPQEARQRAFMLLAAAEYAEEETNG